MNEQRGALVANRDIVDSIPFVQGEATGALVPQNMGQALELAKIMAGGSVGVPKHLRGQPAVCMRIITDALQFGLNPFHLADDSMVINDRLAYGAKSIHAMTLRSGLLNGRLEIDYKGEGQALVCTVSGFLHGSSKVRTKSVRLSQITVMNSPLWKTDPQQQLGYYTERAWCRLHAPDAVMGLVAREDPPIDMMPQVVTIEGGALSQVEAHLAGEPQDETESASGETEGAPVPEAEAAAEQGRGRQTQTDGTTPAPEREAADSAGQPDSEGDYVGKELGLPPEDIMQKRLDWIKDTSAKAKSHEELEKFVAKEGVQGVLEVLPNDKIEEWAAHIAGVREKLDKEA